MVTPPPPPARKRSIPAANDNHPVVAVEAAGLAPITFAELALVETYFGDIIAHLIGREPANDNKEIDGE